LTNRKSPHNVAWRQRGVIVYLKPALPGGFKNRIKWEKASDELDLIIKQSSIDIRHSLKFHKSDGLDSAELIAGRLKDNRSDRIRNFVKANPPEADKYRISNKK